MNTTGRNFAILLAAGKSARTPKMIKQHELIGELPLFYFSLKKLVESGEFEKIVVVMDCENQKKGKKKIKEWNMEKVVIADGGSTRQKSMRSGMASLYNDKFAPSQSDIIVVQNAANPFATINEIKDVVVAAKKYEAACLGHPVTDTLKTVVKKKIVKTIDRKNLWHMQTPQAFSYKIFKSAEQKKILAKHEFTDEMGWVEALGICPVVIQASSLNRKITTLEDVSFARNFLQKNNDFRTGIGQDSHCFDSNKIGLKLGGLNLQDHKKLLGNSDGDVMIHALCNAILQALGEGSFSMVADNLCANGIIDSGKYLAKILKKMRSRNFKLTHVGFQLEGSEPRINPITKELKLSLSGLLHLPEERIGITSTSGEGLTPFGRGEGLQCFAVATLSLSKL